MAVPVVHVRCPPVPVSARALWAAHFHTAVMYDSDGLGDRVAVVGGAYRHVEWVGPTASATLAGLIVGSGHEPAPNRTAIGCTSEYRYPRTRWSPVDDLTVWIRNVLDRYRPNR